MGRKLTSATQKARKTTTGGITPKETNVTTEKTTATKTTIVRVPRLRYAVNAPKIEEFFERAQKRNVTVTLHTAAGVLEDLVPLKINPATYRVQNGHRFTVAKAAVKKIEVTY
jgi:hypothetical protein